MNFKQATDALFDRVDHADLAKMMGISIPLIRQARLSASARSYRGAPNGWQPAIKRLAEQRARHFQRLAKRLTTA